MPEQMYSGEEYGIKQYRLRASSPMPVAEGDYAGNFVIHTFMAEVSYVDIYECTSFLPGSDEFRGQGLAGGLVSASFSRTGDRSGDVFKGRAVHAPSYVDESSLGFNFG
jgi:hypothetical protein